jgi:hypothetical protein
MSFAELVEGWVFCGSRLLRIRYERGRAAADSESDKEVLDKILTTYIDRLTEHRNSLVTEGKDTAAVDIVLQRATSKDYYMSELLGGRFQVAESVTPVGTYYVVDHKMPDLLYRPGGPEKDFPRFDSRDAAFAKVDYLLDIVGKQTTFLSKGRARMAAEKKDALKAQKQKERKERGPSAASRFKELIMEGKLTDDGIFAVIQKEFGLDDNKRSYVSWYRKHLAKTGNNPPDPVGSSGETKPAKAEKTAKAEKPAKAEKKAASTGVGKVLATAAAARKAAASPASVTAKTDKLVAKAKREARGRKPGRSKAA